MNRILVYHNASLGDTIVALPALKLIRKVFKTSTIFLLTVEHQNVKATQAEKILVNTNLIDGYILLQAHHKKLLHHRCPQPHLAEHPYPRAYSRWWLKRSLHDLTPPVICTYDELPKSDPRTVLQGNS